MIFDIAAGESALALDLQRASNVALWRPNGLGARAFYEVSVDTNSITTKRRVAFRTVAVVTGDDTDPAYISKSKNASGTASHGLFLRVNGAAMWARGANVVPRNPRGARHGRKASTARGERGRGRFQYGARLGRRRFLQRRLLRRVRRARFTGVPRLDVRAERPRAARHGH